MSIETAVPKIKPKTKREDKVFAQIPNRLPKKSIKFRAKPNPRIYKA